MKKRIGLLIALLVFALVGSVSASNWDWSWTSTEGSDGVRVYYPASGWTWTEGSDGRRIVYPVSGWNWTESKNGRRVIFPLSGWTWTDSRDGRRIVYPLSGWTWTEGSDGCRVIYPLSGWTWTEGSDGRRIVYPLSGWTWREGPNGRRIAYPYDGDSFARVEDLLYGLFIEKIPLAENLQPHLNLLLEQMGVEYYSDSYDLELRRAHHLLNVNNFFEARDLFRKLSRTGRTDYIRREAAYYIGYCSIKIEDYWQGIQDYRDFLSQYDVPQNARMVPYALYVVGVLYENLSRQFDAVEAYRQCVRRFPHDEYGKLSQERLNVISNSSRGREIAGRHVEVDSRFSAKKHLSPVRINPFDGFRVDSAQIARVCQFIHSVEHMNDTEEALNKLTAADKKLDTVRKYQHILANKQRFENLHKGAQK